MEIRGRNYCCTLLILLALSGSNFAQVRLPKLISDGMVLQRNTKVKVWGWAAAGEKVSVRFNKKSYRATTRADGKWSVILASLKEGGPYDMTITGSNSITIKDVLIGDVWVCSGQSNMEYQLGYDDATYAKEMQEVNFPQIRQFKVPIRPVLTGPEHELEGGSWKTANPRDIRPFSAVAYFFAKKLYQKYGVPIGIINSSVGGTPIEAWTSEEALKAFPSIISVIQKNKDTAYVNGLRRSAGVSRRPDTTQDKGMNSSLPWYDLSYNPKGWKNMTVPAFWEDQGVKDLNGVVWFRKEFDVPASMLNQPARVYLGRIIDADILYINGKQVGRTGSLYSERRYNVPTGLLKAGKNLFVVRITNNNGKGGFVPDKPYYLFTGSDTVSLVGTWQYKVGEVFVPRPAGSGGIAAQNAPSALYNGMIAPFIDYTIKGFLWYQGESNISRAKEYAQLQPVQIIDWRRQWNNKDLPFLFVQMPNYGDYTYLPTESSWAVFRESQFKALSLPNTGMAVTLDIGEWNDIHPWDKHDVGERLALVAQKVAYGENLVYSGPLYQSASIDSNKITISFTSIGSGLTSNDGEELNEFAIAGADKVFVRAKAKIDGDKVIVWSDEVPVAKYVRYAWSDSPPFPNLYNKEGLPASPFRTDSL